MFVDTSSILQKIANLKYVLTIDYRFAHSYFSLMTS